MCGKETKKESCSEMDVLYIYTNTNSSTTQLYPFSSETNACSQLSLNLQVT
jgi:hypothetical protein